MNTPESTAGGDDEQTADWSTSPPATPDRAEAAQSAPSNETQRFHDQDTMAAETINRRPQPGAPLQSAPPTTGWQQHGGPAPAPGPPQSWTTQRPQPAAGYAAPPVTGPPPAWPQQQPWPPQQPPPGQYPPPHYGAPGIHPQPAPTRPNDTRKWLLIGGAIAVVLAVVLVVGLVVANGDDATPSAAPTSTSVARVPAGPVTAPQAPPTASGPSTGVPAPAPPPPAAPVVIAPAALPGLLLPPEQINLRLGTAGMVPAGPVEDGLLKGGVITPANCTGAWGPVHDGTYNGTGFTAVAAQAVNLDPTAKVLQAAVSFPDPAAAKAFYDRQVTDWNSCKFAKITAQYNGGKVNAATLGVPATNADVLTIMVVPDNSDVAGMQCERAMTVRGNVIVDVRACSPTVGSAGFNIARDIGDKVVPAR